MYEQVGWSADGRVIGCPRYDQGAVIVHLDRPSRPIWLSPHKDVRRCAVSPDGRWAATCSHAASNCVKVWDARTGKHEKDFPVIGISWADFSPDGRWLATAGDGSRLYAVGSWQEGPRIDGESLAFSPDSKLLAVGDLLYGTVRLVDPDTGKEHARLEAPEQTRLNPQCFTPDGD
jgi:WD40 repeat protein